MYVPNYGGRRGVRKSAACEAWEYEAAMTAKAQRGMLVPKPFKVAMSVRMFYKYERDIDSSQKALQDCMQGILYDDDSQIVRLEITKEKDAKNPRIEMELSRV